MRYALARLRAYRIISRAIDARLGNLGVRFFSLRTVEQRNEKMVNGAGHRCSPLLRARRAFSRASLLARSRVYFSSLSAPETDDAKIKKEISYIKRESLDTLSLFIPFTLILSLSLSFSLYNAKFIIFGRHY